MTKQQKSLWAKLPQWAWKQGLRNNVDFTLNPDSSSANPERQQPTDCSDIKQAQVITSRVEYPQVTDMHKPVLDIDFPIQCVPSTTPGHFHLYMDKELDWDTYKRLLKALSAAGIIEAGYYRASIARKYTAVRLPWVRKEPQTAAPAPAPTETAHGPENGTQAPAAPTQQFGPAPAAHQPASHGPDLGNRHYDRVIQNIEEANRQRQRTPLAEERRLATQAAIDAANRAAATPAPERDIDHGYRGATVRYNPVYMRYEDGTSYVTAIAMQRHASPNLPSLIEQGAVVENSIGWATLVREHGHPLPQRRSRTIHREEVVIEEEPARTATVTYNRRAQLFTVTSDSDPMGSSPLTVTEEMWREQINGRDTRHIATPLRRRIEGMGIPAAQIGRQFARAWELGIQREPRPLRRPRGSNSILQDVLDAETARQAREAAARAEMAQHYTRLPDPIQPAARWTAEGSDIIGDILAARDRIMEAPAYTPSNLVVQWDAPEAPSEAPVVADPNLPF